MSLFDSHCHIDFPIFDDDRSEVLRKAKGAGVSGLLIPGTDIGQWQRLELLVDRLREQEPRITSYYGVGIHPWWFGRWMGCLEEYDFEVSLKGLQDQLRQAAQLPNCCAIGETGLDLLSSKSSGIDLDVQVAIVRAHIGVANELKLPIILHCVKAHNELIRLLNATPVQHGGVVHGFTGSAQLAQEYWQRGLHIGVGGSITYERAHKTREAVKALPLEALLLETDSPDMPLCGRQGERNSPEYLPEVARALATLRGENYAQVVDACYQNTCDLFLKLTP